VPDPRTLPIAPGHREFIVKVDGRTVSPQNHLVSVYVSTAVNRIAAARLVYLDGAVAASDFPLSNTDTFLPGKKVEILAGSTDSSVSIFQGIVIKQSLKVRQHTAPQLIIECRHQAVKLTVARKNNYYLEQKDGDTLTAILQAAGIAAEVESTTVRFQQQVQFACTDWDYLVTRAQANGKLVITQGDRVTIKAPALGGPVMATLLFGSTILELDAEMDARRQYCGVKSTIWDPAQQGLCEHHAADPAVPSIGNVAVDDLAQALGLGELPLRHPALLDDEAQAWADSEWLLSQMSKVSGRAKCEGLATVAVGDIVKLSGFGDRFGGNVLITGVRHEFDLVAGFKTHLQFGSVDEWLAAAEGSVSAPKAGGLVPGASGLQIGVVVSNEDKEGEFRVQVRMPLISADSDGAWARVAAVDAGDQRGFFFRPEVGDEVVLGFLADDPRQGVILGMLHSSAKAAPLAGSNDNHEKVYQSRSGMKLYFNDDKKIASLSTPAGNKVTLSEAEQTLRLDDQNGNKIELGPSGITIASAKGLHIKAENDVELESGQALHLKGGAELKLEGGAGAELSSAAVTKVKGSLVQLN